MKYINSLKGTLIALVIYSVGINFIPEINYQEELKTVLTVSTFLFATLSGFFSSRLHKRYNQIRYYTASEDAEWLSIYFQSKLLGAKTNKQFTELIDEYLRIALDHDLGEYYTYNAHKYAEAYEILDQNKTKDHNKIAVKEVILKTLQKIEYYRNNSSVLYREKVNTGQWGVLTLLASIITFSLFSLTANNPTVKIVTVLLASCLVMVLLLMRDLHKLCLEDPVPLLESAQEVFELIGKPNYYHYSYFDPKKIQSKTVRVGLHEPGQKPKIKLIKTAKK